MAYIIPKKIWKKDFTEKEIDAIWEIFLGLCPSDVNWETTEYVDFFRNNTSIPYPETDKRDDTEGFKPKHVKEIIDALKIEGLKQLLLHLKTQNYRSSPYYEDGYISWKQVFTLVIKPLLEEEKPLAAIGKFIFGPKLNNYYNYKNEVYEALFKGELNLRDFEPLMLKKLYKQNHSVSIKDLSMEDFWENRKELWKKAAGEKIAVKTAEISMEYCLNGTSNLRALRVSPFIKAHMVGGTMAHSYIMSYETELRAFQVWNEIFPNTSFLVDTFDTIKAVRKIVRNNLKPKNVRIDSGDFFTVCQEVRDILDENGWNDVGIYISGDLTPELLTELTTKKVPFDQAMIGTKLTNLGEIVNINPGFVYKLVEYTRDGKKYYPVKKASGKGNYPGLKEVIVENGKLHIKPGFGFVNPNLIIENMEVINDF